MPNVPRPWGEAEDATLAKLWAEGLSARQIANALGTGRSRNAVIGRIHRKGLQGRSKDQRDRPGAAMRIKARRKASMRFKARRKAALRIARITAEPFTPTEELGPLGDGVSILALTDLTCRYPIGDPQEAGFTFCGRTRDRDCPYCIGHARIAYAPITKRQKRSTERLANWLDRRSFKATAQA